MNWGNAVRSLGTGFRCATLQLPETLLHGVAEGGLLWSKITFEHSFAFLWRVACENWSEIAIEHGSEGGQ